VGEGILVTSFLEDSFLGLLGESPALSFLGGSLSSSSEFAAMAAAAEALRNVIALLNKFGIKFPAGELGVVGGEVGSSGAEWAKTADFFLVGAPAGNSGLEEEEEGEVREEEEVVWSSDAALLGMGVGTAAGP
jgi:hypothetical protein